MVPIVPHFSNECLNILDLKEIKWPKFDEAKFKEDKVNIVIQINGKKRALIQTDFDISENNLLNIINKDLSLKKYFKNNEIKRKIYIKNKLMNIII